MPTPAITLSDLETICCQAAARPQSSLEESRPTAKQIYFFTLVWLLKKKVAWQHLEDLLAGQDLVTLTGRADLVRQHLGDWSLTIARLKQRQETEWELLRIQMEKAVKYYPAQIAELKADALHDALLKILSLLNKMISWPELEEADIPALILETHPTLTNIYDFGSPFYAFAKRLTRNELVSQLRKANRTLLEDLAGILPDPSSSQALKAYEETELQPLRLLQLKIDLAKLLEIIVRHLRPKPAQVILQSLNGRAGFWQALEMTGLGAPEGLSPNAAPAADVEIARALGMTENNVRVHRALAKKVVQNIDPVSGLLLEGFLNRHGKATYRLEINVAEALAYNHHEGKNKERTSSR